MTNLKTHIRAHSLLASALLWGALSALWGCNSDAPPTAAAIHQRDSLPVMTTLGVSKLISDSGVIRYKVIAERWDIYDQTKPPRQEFPHGIFLQQFDEKFHVSLYLTADTAYCYNQTLWKLRGRVFARNAKGATFSSEELYWDMDKHILYSHCYTHVVEPGRELEGNSFRANEQMTEYEVIWSKGYMPMPKNNDNKPQGNAADTAQKDTVPMRPGPMKHPNMSAH